MKYIIFLFTIAVYISFNIFAQENIVQDTMELSDEYIYDALNDSEQQQEDDIINDEIIELMENPIDLNEASMEELNRIPAITNLLVTKIIERRSISNFKSVRELYEIEGMTRELYTIIRNFVKVKRIKDQEKIKGLWMSRLATDIERRQGYIDNTYLGSPFKTLTRFRLYSNHTSILNNYELGGQIEKDAGEKNYSNYTTLYCYLKFNTVPISLIVGDYNIRSAEGLVLWNGTNIYKGSDVISTTRRNGAGIIPHKSSNENAFYRGIAVKAEYEYFQLQCFYSNRSVNATIDSNGIITKIDESGLFRTEAELRKYKSAKETFAGFKMCEKILNNVKFGQTGFIVNYSKPLYLPNGRITSSELYMYGLDLSYTKKTIDIYSEIGFDMTNKLASLMGVNYEPVSFISISILTRNYPAYYSRLHNNFFSESSSDDKGEKGVYYGLRIKPLHWLIVSSYYDQFKINQVKQSLPFSVQGNEFFIQVESRIKKNLRIKFRFKNKEMPCVIEKNDLYGREYKDIISSIKNSYRIMSYFNSSSKVQIISKVEWLNIKFYDVKKNEDGLVLSQSVKWCPTNAGSIKVNACIFETSSYESRIYDWEEEYKGVYVGQFLYGQGIKYSFLLEYNMFANAFISFKYSKMTKTRIKSIGTGKDRIEGNTLRSINFQINVKF